MAPTDERKHCLHCGQMKVGCSEYETIPLTWPEAMKWRDWAVKEFGELDYMLSLLSVYKTTAEYKCGRFEAWVAAYAQPEHYIKAACLCKIESEN